MAIHIRWDPPSGSDVMTLEDLGPPFLDRSAAKREIEARYPGAYYSEPLAGLTHIGAKEIIHVWKDPESWQRQARAVAWIVQTSW